MGKRRVENIDYKIKDISRKENKNVRESGKGSGTRGKKMGWLAVLE